MQLHERAGGPPSVKVHIGSIDALHCCVAFQHTLCCTSASVPQSVGVRLLAPLMSLEGVLRRRVLAGGVFVWSLATALVPVTVGYLPGLYLCRLLVSSGPGDPAQWGHTVWASRTACVHSVWS